MTKCRIEHNATQMDMHLSVCIYIHTVIHIQNYICTSNHSVCTPSIVVMAHKGCKCCMTNTTTSRYNTDVAAAFECCKKELQQTHSPFTTTTATLVYFKLPKSLITSRRQVFAANRSYAAERVIE